MTSRDRVGKIDLRTFESFLMPRLGVTSDRVRIGPRTGIDAAVFDVGDRSVVIAEDPIFPAVGLPLETFGWFTIHIGASDVAVLGVRPELATYSLLMPPGTPEEDFEVIVESIHRAAVELDITIVGGHTGYYPVLTVPIIGGITVMGIAAPEEVVSPAGARPGDAVLMTKGPAIEAVGLLATLYEDELRQAHGDSVTEAALARCRQITVVEDALMAAQTGAVTAMHDATEGGVLGGLWEMAEAAGVGMEIDAAAMLWPEDVEALCATLSIDPLAAIAEGTLLLTVPEADVAAVIGALAGKGIPCTQIGRVIPEAGHRVITRRDGTVEELAVPGEDPFWPAFFAGVEKLQEGA